uniref:CUB domain-containing protein n=1 Tax=Panagrolaimus davidi TaxID=227884 RepID=A0A914PNX6_9BILA
MESDKVIFFESPDFPRYMEYGEECYMNFTKNILVQEKNKRFVIVTSNELCKIDHDPFYSCETLFDSMSNFTSYNFHIYNIYERVAFQGFAYFDDWGDDCPLESVSRVNPFQFTDLKQVLVLHSTYKEYHRRNQSCLWQFKAPINYGFKIVITNLDILNGTIFKVENSRDTIITPANVRVSQPHYSMDNYLKIYLSKNNYHFSPVKLFRNVEFEFTAYVTIIRNFFTDDRFNCNSTNSTSLNSTTTWSFLSDKGYPSNSQCTYTMKIPPGTEVIATLTKSDIEENVDMINYYFENNSLPNIYGQINSYGLAFSNHNNENEKEKEIFWEFVSDGNCNCSNPVILVPCFNGTEIYLMDNAGEFYCGNLNCSFTVI